MKPKLTSGFHSGTVEAVTLPGTHFAIFMLFLSRFYAHALFSNLVCTGFECPAPYNLHHLQVKTTYTYLILSARLPPFASDNIQHERIPNIPLLVRNAFLGCE